MNLNKFWRVYLLTKEPKNSDLEFASVKFEQDSENWEILSTQVFEEDNKLFLSVLWLTKDE